MPREVRILVTGGGTGGHVSPALAVVQTVREMAEGTDWTPVFRYVGSDAGVEAKLAREAGIEFVGVASGKLRRSSRGPLGLLTGANLRDAFRVPVGVLQAATAVRRFRPDAVLATGGYVSVPPVIAAGLQRVPVLVHEQTVTVGLANRIAGRFARRIALSFEGSRDELPPLLRARAFVTGNPVRAAIFGGDRARAVERFGFGPAGADDLPAVYVTGGAQGSRILNRTVEDALPDLLALCRVLHQCGRQPEGTEQSLDRLTARAAALPDDLKGRYAVRQFIETAEIADAFALSDLVVGRSGAGTVTELCALGKPALFVPLVPASGDEQTKNARRSEQAGAARILSQSECDGPHLLAAVRDLLSDRARLSAMGTAAHTLARPDAARDLAVALLELAGVTP
jgi:UDP-N-acetylglucosamine--N-acetylmuramyl-(pentapeptide) pyrophosphoryl-undecaprenol N-acetylglucosamine transferase